MKYYIFFNQQDLLAKDVEIMTSEPFLFPNSKNYATLAECKHPTQEKWAMPVIESVHSFFDSSQCVDELSSDWYESPQKLA